MKIYQQSKMNKLLSMMFIFFAISLNCFLLMVSCFSLLKNGLSKDSLFLSAFSLLISFLLILFLKKYHRIMMVSYAISPDGLIVFRWKNRKRIGFNEITDLHYENKKLTFKDSEGESYFVPSDFENNEELFEMLKGSR